MKIFFQFIVLLVLCSCSSAADQDKNFHFIVQKNANSPDLPIIVKVIESSSKIKEPWLYDTENWIKKNEKNYGNYRYFLYTSEPTVNRSVCLDLANSKVLAMVLKALPESGGDEVSGMVSGAQTLKTYWKTVRMKGSENLYEATICSVLVKISLKDMMNIRIEKEAIQ